MVRLATIAGSLACACAVSACVQPTPLVVQGRTGGAAPVGAWSATLTGVGESSELRGSATVARGRTIRETQAHVMLTGATPNAVHPWFLQLGDCENDHGVLGGLMAYPPIVVDENGQGRVNVTLPFTMPTSGRYFVSVRRSEALVSTVIACGNLTTEGVTTASLTAARSNASRWR